MIDSLGGIEMEMVRITALQVERAQKVLDKALEAFKKEPTSENRSRSEIAIKELNDIIGKDWARVLAEPQLTDEEIDKLTSDSDMTDEERDFRRELNQIID
jgi:hypothetical protein